MIKRILAVLICVVMICSILPQITLFSSAAEDAEIDFTEAAAWEEYWDQYWKDHPEEWNNLESETASQRPATRSTSSDLSSMRVRAEAIVNYQWTPSKNITTWNSNSYNGKTYFPTGSTVKGVPYTLFTSEVVSRSLCSLEQYKAVASSNYSASAYCVSTGSNRTGPVYGSCCADLVSEVFGGNFMNGSSPRYHSVGSIWNSSYGTTIHNQKMSDIRAGDAISDYPNHYHIMWVGEVTDTTITIYEQTPPVARKITLNKSTYTDSSGRFKYGSYIYSTIKRSKE